MVSTETATCNAGQCAVAGSRCSQCRTTVTHHARRSLILLPLSLSTECFCAKCDALIHARKKNKTHVREAIEVVEPEPEPVPCDSDAAHVAVMYCEDCEENFCAGQLRIEI